MLEFTTNSVAVKLNGVEYSIPVNNLSMELSVELSEVEKRKSIFITKINEKQNVINSIRDFIQSGKKMSGEEISEKLSDIDEHSEELAKLNKEVESVVFDFYKLYITNYEEHKAIIRQIPIEHVWEFIQELFYASQGKKKVNLPEPILSEAKSQSSKTKPVYVKRGLKKRK
jgi:uncharacterized FlaG/YvyC family protein